MPTHHAPLELWGGVECTLNRVHDRFFSQLDCSGHHLRLEQDLERFADLGLHTLRSGILWESFDVSKSWAYADRLLSRMAELRMEPIVGLLHHGSGPASTNLLDPQLPRKLAAYALQVARRYPHVTAYTPVNEPQTTGRFACLYGHWYPHERSMTLYLRALLLQIKAVALSMRAIRTVQHAARLVHTEDGGQIFSTPELESLRIEREHRRWLGTDLLCGLVDRHHPVFPVLIEHGIPEGDIFWFADHPTPPDVLGLNYYPTSDRFLDHRTHLYPPHFTGGDTGLEPLVDIEAVRVRRQGIPGPGAVLEQAWQRYRLPLAITEVHLGSDPEQQVRWLTEVWCQAQIARAKGADVRAITLWALLGSHNWPSLCTQDTGVYEPGVFRLIEGEPTETLLVPLARTLAQSLDPAPAGPGWWRLDDRLDQRRAYPPASPSVPLHAGAMVGATV